MTKDEALKLALEALEANYLLVNGTETHGGLEQCLDGYYSGCFDTDPINKQTEEAITAIKEALAQPQRTWVGLSDAEIIDAWHWGGTDPHIEGAHFTVLYKYFETKLKDKNHV